MQPTENAAVQVRLTGAEFDSLENWRRAQGKIPPRSEAIREAIRRLVRPADDPPVVRANYDKHRDST
jgi:Arc/MetJ-type ribon-helix-helix transcriptional regulator